MIPRVGVCLPARSAAVLWCALGSIAGRAQVAGTQGGPPPQPPPPGAGQVTRALRFEVGHVVVGGGLATIDLPAGFRYLQQDDARFLVENVWRNPARTSTLGLVLPPAGDDWGIIVSYEACGQVDEGDGHLDADLLLGELKDEVEALNPLRARSGQPQAQLVGWADAPTYDPAGKTLRWGKVLAVAGAAQPTVNYEGRVLGADGVLALQAVADARRLAALRVAVLGVLAGAHLAPGTRFADHDPARHRRAGYGLEGLIVSTSARVPLWRVVLKPVLALVVVLVVLAFGRRRSAGARA